MTPDSPGLMARVLLSSQSLRRRRALGAFLRTMAPVVPTRPPPTDPIFVIGAPRSGTSLLFDVLDRSPAVRSLGTESHLLWEMFHPLADSFSPSQALGPNDASERERKVVSWCIHALAGEARYLDKAPRNTLRVEFLRALFSTAWFVFIKRDGRDTVSSLITGWRSERRFGPPFPPPTPLAISGYRGPTWKFVVPPGWERFARATLPEVCAFQWVAANEAVMEARERLGPDRWVEVSYEDLVGRPLATMERLLRSLRLPLDEEPLSYAKGLSREFTDTVVTPPRTDKWRTENPGDVESVLPIIAPMMQRLGYRLEPR